MLPTDRHRSGRHRAGRHRGERRALARPLGVVGAAAVTVAASIFGLGLAAGADRAPAARAPGPAATTLAQEPSPPATAATASPATSDQPVRQKRASAARPADTQRTKATEAAKPTKAEVPEQGTGTFRIAPGTSAAVGHGALVTYSVEVEEGLPFRPAEVATVVDAVLGDARGWTAAGAHRLQRVAEDPNYRIRLTSPATTDRLCSPLNTGGRLSCRNGHNVVLNAWRWVNGAAGYRADLTGYRTYLINHEFGHALGNSHVACPGDGLPAPVMLQQTKTLDGCAPNPWPVP